MPIASIGRRRWLQAASALYGHLVGRRRAMADPARSSRSRQLCDTLLRIMKAGSRHAVRAALCDVGAGGRPGAQPADDPSGFCGSSVVQPAPNEQAALLAAFRRYTVASYVNSFDKFNGQHFDIQPDTRTLPNGEQLVQTKIVHPPAKSHELDYVMRQEAAPGRLWMCWRTVRSAASPCSGRTFGGWLSAVAPRR